uniref:Uncharacterized protein n=1 Tax=Peronospora matthiolae TaxID=2874970 RepID=A0AAV1UAV5_9STRA
MRVELSDDGGYRLDQEEAIGDLLQSNGLTDANATLTLIENHSKDEQQSDAELFGSVNAPPEPTVRDLKSLVAKRIARYLKGTAKLKITMKPSQSDNAAALHCQNVSLDAFSDADFAGDRADRKSMTGGVLLLNVMPIRWDARKQGGVSLSTMEAEFVAASEIAWKMLGVQEMLMEIGLSPALPMQLPIDIQAAISQIVVEGKARGLPLQVLMLSGRCRFIEARYVMSELMLADLLTKALDRNKLRTLRVLMKIG